MKFRNGCGGSVAMVFTVILALLALVFGIWSGQHWFPGQDPAKRVPRDFPGTVLPGEGKTIPPFSLLDDDGRAFDSSSLKGKWSLLFFGYTFCPDICPTTLAILKSVYTDLAKSAKGVDDVAIVFVSVDPERDTPERLKEYMSYFNPAFIGVTGDPAKLATFSRSLGAAYSKVEGTSKSGYLVNHTASVFLIDPEGNFKALLSPPHEAAKMAAGLNALRD